MSLRTFLFGLSASFGFAWLGVILIPYLKMRNLQPIEWSEAVDGETGVFNPKRTGRIADGALVYAANGCYLCHTQVVRPTYAGNDLYRPDWGGLAADPERGDTRRETNPYDFEGERFAQVGVSRMGPDLSNLGRRVESIYAVGGDPTQWLLAQRYNPRFLPEREKSLCPPSRYLFTERVIRGAPSDRAVAVRGDIEIVPNSDALALVSYLLSLKKDHPVPAVLDFAPPKAQAAP